VGWKPTAWHVVAHCRGERAVQLAWGGIREHEAFLGHEGPSRDWAWWHRSRSTCRCSCPAAAFDANSTSQWTSIQISKTRVSPPTPVRITFPFRLSIGMKLRLLDSEIFVRTPIVKRVLRVSHLSLHPADQLGRLNSINSVAH